MKKKTRHVIRYNAQGDAYFIKFGRRFYLKDFLRNENDMITLFNYNDVYKISFINDFNDYIILERIKEV